MHAELRVAIAATDWPRALGLALDAWRETRHPTLANLIDAIGARCGLPEPPRAASQHHAWWMEHAAPYDPIRATRLASEAATRATASDVTWSDIVHRWPKSRPIEAIHAARSITMFFGNAKTEALNWIDRIAALFAWPDDPRVASVLVELLATAPFHFDSRIQRALYGAIGDKLVALADVRIVDRLAVCIGEPRADTPEVRAIQVEVARAVHVQLAELDARHAASPELLQLAALVTPATRRSAIDLDALWREVAEQPGDDGPRIVLADALAEAGDGRGELITLQLAGTVHHANRAGGLLRTEWSRWLGDVSLIVTRKGTEFRRGMLETARVGQISTPDWAWDKIAGHRELGTVHTIRPGDVEPANYARFISHCEHARDIVAETPDLFAALRAVRPRWSISTLRYHHKPTAMVYPTLGQTFHQVAATLPDLEVIVFGDLMGPATLPQLVELIPSLPYQFPRLRAIRLVGTHPLIARDFAMTHPVRTMPLVEVIARFAD